MKCWFNWTKLDCVYEQPRHKIQASGDMSGDVMFTLSKEMMPDSFNSTDQA